MFLLFHETDRDGLGEILVGDGLDIGVDFAVEHINDAGGVSGELGVVGDHNNSVAFGVDLF